MNEDQLTRAERVRLEALAQTLTFVSRCHFGDSVTIETVLLLAEKTEAWLLKAGDNIQ